jgi:hypothetical protein
MTGAGCRGAVDNRGKNSCGGLLVDAAKRTTHGPEGESWSLNGYKSQRALGGLAAEWVEARPRPYAGFLASQFLVGVRAHESFGISGRGSMAARQAVVSFFSSRGLCQVWFERQPATVMASSLISVPISTPQHVVVWTVNSSHFFPVKSGTGEFGDLVSALFGVFPVGANQLMGNL